MSDDTYYYGHADDLPAKIHAWTQKQIRKALVWYLEHQTYACVSFLLNRDGEKREDEALSLEIGFRDLTEEGEDEHIVPLEPLLLIDRDDPELTRALIQTLERVSLQLRLKLKEKTGSAPPSPSSVKIAFTVSEFLAASGLKRSQFYAELKAGRIEAVKVGGKTLIPAPAAIKWLESLPRYQPADDDDEGQD